MRLKPRFDPSGVLWFDNYAVTYLRWFERWYNPPKRRLLSATGILYLFLTLALWGIEVAGWAQGAPIAGPDTWVLIVLSVGVAAYAFYRRRHPLFHPTAPLCVGFTPEEIVWQAQDGRTDRRAWRAISEVRIEREELGGLTVTLRSQETSVLRSLHPGLAIKIGWAFKVWGRGPIDVASLARSVEPVRLPALLPAGSTHVLGSRPAIYLYPSRLVVLTGTLKLLEYRQADVDAFEYLEPGWNLLVVTAGDRKISQIPLTGAGPFLEWLVGAVRAGGLIEGAAERPPGPPDRVSARTERPETGRLK